ncbi:MAG: agmatinase [Proteobacteria bacterium]|nr:MAG: agmatinase [Pseudomonadota bacterium]
MDKPSNFLALEPNYSKYESAAAVMLPIPFDGTSTYGKGADRGPQALIEASSQVELFDIETRSEMYLRGVYTAPAVSGPTPEAVNSLSEKRCLEYLEDGKFVMSIGGEHSVSLGPIKAHLAKYRDLSVLQLDAHSDMREDYLGSKFNHACIMARVSEIVPKIAAVGIRSMDSSEMPRINEESTFFAERIAGQAGWEDEVIAQLTDNVYITLDLDVFDPAYLPSTGTPEPGGLDWYQVTGLIRAVCERKNLVGCDIVELCPQEGARASDFLAAKLAYKILSYKFAS